MYLFSPWQRHVLSSVVILSYILRFEARPQQSDLFKQIDRDLHNFRAGISIDMVEQVYCSNSDQGQVAAVYEASCALERPTDHALSLSRLQAASS